jgi:hypothetical protein
MGEMNVTEDIGAELEAIKTLQATLEPLKPEVRTRVLDYVFRVLGIVTPHAAATGIAPPAALGLTTPFATSAPKPLLDGPKDILMLKEQKQPSSGTQMIALMAYYLAHLAPEGERRDTISVDDISKYFVQAQYPLPGSKSQALIHAKNAGYLDPSERGEYRLNSVGYNLVAHKMPVDGASPRKKTAGSRKKTAKKSAKKTKKK